MKLRIEQTLIGLGVSDIQEDRTDSLDGSLSAPLLLGQMSLLNRLKGLSLRAGPHG